MSAASATAPAAAPRKPIRRPLQLPPWAKAGSTWFPTPVGLIHLLTILTPSAIAVLVNLLHAAWKQEANETDVKQAKLASDTSLDVDTVQASIDELEEIGAIRKRAKLECRKKGESRFFYELLVDDWAKLKALPVAEEPAAEEVAEEPVAEEPVAEIAVPQIKLGRNESKPIAIPAAAASHLKSYRCQNRSDYPIALDATLKNGTLSIDIFVEKTEVVRRSHGETTVLSRADANPEAPPPALAELRQAELRQMLNRQLGPHLGFVTDFDLLQIGTALDGCPIDRYARRLHQRRALFTGGEGTWGGALLIAHDCAKAFAAATSAPATPAAQPPAQPSPDRQIEYEAHCERLAQESLDALPDTARKKLIAEKTREIKQRFQAAATWSAAMLRDQAERLARAEALKQAHVPTYAEFCAAAPKAKGAGA